MAKFIIEYNGRKGYYFVMKANCGDLILTSDEYRNSAHAYHAVKSIVGNKQDDHNYQRIKTSDGRWYFVFTTSLGQTIGVSELLESVDKMETMINVVKRSGKRQRIFIRF